MTAYVLVEGHGETDAVHNLLSRLGKDLGLSGMRWAPPIRARGLNQPSTLVRFAERVRVKRDVDALLVMYDDEDGCPRQDGPGAARLLATLDLPFPTAVVLPFREYESLFLPCIAEMAGKPFEAPGGLKRPGLVSHASFDGDYEGKRDVKGLISGLMPKGVVYKPTVDQLPLTRLVSFETVRRQGLAWFGTLERALRFLSTTQGTNGKVYP